MRTARGAGRDAGRREDALERLRPFADEEEGRLLVLRDRVLEPLVLFLLLVPDVLELRDPGGEDVRVAMLRPYGPVTPVTWITRVRVVGGPPLGGQMVHPPFPLSDVLLKVSRVTRATWVPGASRNRRKKE